MKYIYTVILEASHIQVPQTRNPNIQLMSPIHSALHWSLDEYATNKASSSLMTSYYIVATLLLQCHGMITAHNDQPRTMQLPGGFLHDAIVGVVQGSTCLRSGQYCLGTTAAPGDTSTSNIDIQTELHLYRCSMAPRHPASTSHIDNSTSDTYKASDTH